MVEPTAYPLLILLRKLENIAPVRDPRWERKFIWSSSE